MDKKAVATQTSTRATLSKRASQNLLTNPGMIGSVLLLLIVIAVISVNTAVDFRNHAVPPSPPRLEADFPSQGQDHIAQGASHPPYNSNPPTSGWHYAAPADWGIYQQIVPDEVVIHNLEHGGVWLSYRDAGDQQTIQQLEEIARRFPDHVILTYRPTNDKAIAVAAWGHLLKLDTVDSNVILDFILRYIRKGPENV